MDGQIFLSPQVKRSVSLIINLYIQVASQIAGKLKTYVLGNQEITGKYQIFIELLPSAYSSSRNEKFFSTSKNFLKNKLNFCRSALFNMKTRVSLKYLGNNCGCSHMDMNGFRPVTARSRYILADCGWLRVVMVGLG